MNTVNDKLRLSVAVATMFNQMNDDEKNFMLGYMMATAQIKTQNIEDKENISLND